MHGMFISRKKETNVFDKKTSFFFFFYYSYSFCSLILTG